MSGLFIAKQHVRIHPPATPKANALVYANGSFLTLAANDDVQKRALILGNAIGHEVRNHA